MFVGIGKERRASLGVINELRVNVWDFNGRVSVDTNLAPGTKKHVLHLETSGAFSTLVDEFLTKDNGFESVQVELGFANPEIRAQKRQAYLEKVSEDSGIPVDIIKKGLEEGNAFVYEPLKK